MGEGQYFQPTVKNRLSKTILLTKFNILFGKFYDINNRFEETTTVGGTKIKPKGDLEWGHSGRQASPSGTEGTFEVHLDESDENIAEIYWSSPFGASGNKLYTKFVKEGYFVALNGFSFDSGPLGSGTITILEG